MIARVSQMLIHNLWFKLFHVSRGHFCLIRVQITRFIIRKVKRMIKIILFFWIEIFVFSLKSSNIMYFFIWPLL